MGRDTMDFNAQVIVADVPFLFKTWSENGRGRSAENHYTTMSWNDLQSLPVKSIADPAGCRLFLWASGPVLPQMLDLGLAWGFQYKTWGPIWVKTGKHTMRPVIGTGYHFRGNPEICLMFTVGKPARASKGASVLVETQDEAVYAPRLSHSAKPDTVLDRIEMLCGDVMYVELFARHTRPGWYTLGNEVPGHEGEDIFDALANLRQNPASYYTKKEGTCGYVPQVTDRKA